MYLSMYECMSLRFLIFLYDLSVNLKNSFGKTKRDQSLVFVILDNKYRVKDTQIFR